MNIIKITFIVYLLLYSPFLSSQITLEANGPGETYELINSVLAPGNAAVENPECIHPEFGRHIAEVWDTILNQYVFEFYSHVVPDNDRCINFDRQRIEIKTYASSPDNLKGVSGETVTYKWKFKIPIGFQPSTSFTHIHQIKAVGGNDDAPLFTLTPRKGSSDRLELIHNNTTKVSTVDLSLFIGEWVECEEVVYIDSLNGTYSLTIQKISDGTILLNFYKSGLMTIRSDNDFIRPKWGIYRSLDHPSDLRDETLRFAGFSIQEGITGGILSEPILAESIFLEPNYPNPFNSSTTFRYRISKAVYIKLIIYDCLGNEVCTIADGIKSAGNYIAVWNADGYPSGIYICRLQTETGNEVKKMILLK